MRDKRLMVKFRILMLGCLCAGCFTLVLWNQNHLHRSLRSLEGYHVVVITKNTSTTTTATTSMNFTNYAFALMTEPRCYAATPFVLENALTHLPDTFKVVVFYSLQHDTCMKNFVTNSTVLQQAHAKGRLILRHDIPMQANIGGARRYNPKSWNNQLYSDPKWWESLLSYGQVVLTLQSDTLLCSSSAVEKQPWHRVVNLLGGISGQARGKIGTPPDIATLNASHQTNRYHLNGGLSMRRIPWIVSCLKKYKGRPQVEDRLFHHCVVEQDHAQNVSDAATATTIFDAMAFASDSGHTLCFDWEGQRQCPWGVHKPWAAIPYNHRDAEYEELVQYCPDIRELQNLQYDLVVDVVDNKKKRVE